MAHPSNEWERFHLKEMTIQLERRAFAFPGFDARRYDRYTAEEVMAAREALLRERAARARERADVNYVAQFAERIRSQFPGCPALEAEAIARRACEKYSGRVGRSFGAEAFDPQAIELAVRTHVRHEHTEYDRLLARGGDRSAARAAVAGRVLDFLVQWSRGLSA